MHICCLSACNMKLPLHVACCTKSTGEQCFVLDGWTPDSRPVEGLACLQIGTLDHAEKGSAVVKSLCAQLHKVACGLQEHCRQQPCRSPDCLAATHCTMNAEQAAISLSNSWRSHSTLPNSMLSCRNKFS